MKRKNFLLVSFLALAMVFSVASCSSSDDPENKGNGTETPGGGNDTLYFPEKGCHLGTNRSDNET